MNETVGNWAKSEREHAIRLWRTQMRGDAPVKDDTAMTDADIAANNLISGRSAKQQSAGAHRRQAAYSVDRRCRCARHAALSAATNAPVMIYPNPLNPKKYVVINSGITFREYAESNNALQVAYLPDYAIVDLTTPPDPGGRADRRCGFFGEKWELLPNYGEVKRGL